MEPIEMRKVAERLARGRCTASHDLCGETFEAALTEGRRWYPRVAGEYVKSPGFDVRADAISFAREFRQQCRRFLAEAPRHD